MKRICIVGISGKLGQYMTEHALARGYEVRGVCRPRSVRKLARWGDRIAVFPGRTDDRAVIARAVAGCDGVLTVLAPWGVRGYASGTAQAVLDHAAPGARLVFSCGWHVSRDGLDRYGWKIRAIVRFGTPLFRLVRLVDLDDQVEACRRVFESGTDWTVVRGSDLEEGPSEGLPVWAERAHDPRLARNMMRRTDLRPLHGTGPHRSRLGPQGARHHRGVGADGPRRELGARDGPVARHHGVTGAARWRRDPSSRARPRIPCPFLSRPEGVLRDRLAGARPGSAGPDSGVAPARMIDPADRRADHRASRARRRR